jgi:hypothetical protein
METVTKVLITTKSIIFWDMTSCSPLSFNLNGLHSVISQKMILFITTAVKTSNLTCITISLRFLPAMFPLSCVHTWLHGSYCNPVHESQSPMHMHFCLLYIQFELTKTKPKKVNYNFLLFLENNKFNVCYVLFSKIAVGKTG